MSWKSAQINSYWFDLKNITSYLCGSFITSVSDNWYQEFKVNCTYIAYRGLLDCLTFINGHVRLMMMNRLNKHPNEISKRKNKNS